MRYLILALFLVGCGVDPINPPIREPISIATPEIRAPRVFIITYHAIAEDPSDLMHVTPEVFRRDLDFINGKMRTVTFSQYYDLVKSGEGLAEDLAVINFDDAINSDYVYAFPELKERGMTATFFITTSYVGRPGRTTWDQVYEMHFEGFEIGSHAFQHVQFSQQSGEGEKDWLDRISFQYQQSRQDIFDHLGVYPRTMALPYGNGFDNPTVISVGLESGYELIRGWRRDENISGVTTGFSKFVVPTSRGLDVALRKYFH